MTATTTATTGNRYLHDTFAPVRDELTATDLSITGHLPDHLDGRYLRIGPNPVVDPGDDHHWFLGDGMVHGVALRDGAAQWYRNRWVRSASVAAELGEPVRGTPGGADFAANTNVLEHAGRTLALVEGGSPPYELTYELDTVGPCDFGGTLPSRPGRPGYTAHPHEDPETGELHAVSYSWMRGNRVDYSVLDTSGRIRRSVDIKVHGSPMMHDFALTEQHIVILDLPVTFDTALATSTAPKPVRPVVRGVLNRIIGRNPVPEPLIALIARGNGGAPPSFPYRWNPDYPARIGVLHREASGDEIRWFEIDPCYIFHTLNAYDDGETVVVDVVRHPRMFASVLNGPDEGPTRISRFTLDLVSGTAREQGLDERSQEFPRHDERLTGRRHRYGYAVGFEGGETGDTVLRHDLGAGTTQVRRLGAGLAASEFCFVPRPGGAEDEGILMGYVHDRAAGRSDLRVLDAATLEDVAAVHLPGRVPAGFHGNWAPTAG